MNPLNLFLRELRYRRGTFLLAVLAAALVAGGISGARLFVAGHDRETERLLEEMRDRTEQRMAALRDDARVFSKSLGFNILILPEAQDPARFYADHRSTHFFESSQTAALAASDPAYLNHLLPVLRHRAQWEEFGGDVILVGIEGQIYIKSPEFQTPIQEPIAPGTAHVGDAVRRTLGLSVGDTIRLMDRELTVVRLLAQQGNADDVSLLLNLGDLQQMVGLQGKVGGILALSCNCGVGDTHIIADDVHRTLPGAQVIEFTTLSNARETARTSVAERTRAQIEDLKSSREALRTERIAFARMLVLSVSLTSLLLLAVLAFLNVQERRTEIAMLRALGMRRPGILGLFLGKALAAGLAGAVLGSFAAVALAASLGGPDFIATPDMILPAIAASVAVALLSSLLPSLRAAATDPATILNQE